MEQDYPDARQPEEFNWFAPWQWERIVQIRVGFWLALILGFAWLIVAATYGIWFE